MEEYALKFFDSVIQTLIDTYNDVLVDVLLLAIMTAFVSAFSVEPILRVFILDSAKVERYKPLAFFVINVLWLTLLGGIGTFPSQETFGHFLAGVIFISSVSSAIYYYFPQIMAGLRRYRIQRINNKNGGLNGSNT